MPYTDENGKKRDGSPDPMSRRVDLMKTARHYAQSSANYLTCAASWSDWSDKEEDDRDPKMMMLESLASAEKDAREAIKYIERIRASSA